MDTSSSQSYTLENLLGGDIALVIPDLQRDYCWGLSGRAYSFVHGIAHLYQHHSITNMGLLYGFENPPGSHHLHIIDGHQRIVTLYLLLGMLYRRAPSDWLRRLLISDYSLIDNREPRLLYQSRREALYFMSDLVTCFFLDRNGRLSQLEQSDWYYRHYDVDANVQNFIAAIRDIDRVLEEIGDCDYSELARFVATKLMFLYFDTSSRHEAENIFIAINTTGTPLSRTQDMRWLSMVGCPQELHSQLAEKWNEIEDWHWQHRDETSSYEDFISLYLSQLPEGEHFSMETLYPFFKAYSKAAIIAATDNHGKKFDAKVPFLALPMIAFVQKWPEKENENNARRFWHLLANTTRYQQTSTTGSDVQPAIDLVRAMTRADVLSLLKTRRVSQRILNEDEREKLEFIAKMKAAGLRAPAEAALARAEAHPLLNGKAARLTQWAHIRGAEPAEILENLQRYVQAIYDIWGTDINKRLDLDLLRRAMLTLCQDGFPLIRRGAAVASLCWYDYDWQRLMLQSPGLIRQLIDRCGDCHNTADYARHMEAMVKKFDDPSYPYNLLVQHPEILATARKKQVTRHCEAFMSIYDMDLCANRWYIGQCEAVIASPEWSALRPYGGRCIYTDNADMDLAMDLYYTPDERSRFRLEMFRRSLDSISESEARRMLDDPALRAFHYDRKRRRLIAYLHNATAATNLLRALTSELL